MRLAVFLPLLLAAALSSCSTAPKAPAEIPRTVEAYTKVVEDRLGPIWYRTVGGDSSATIGTVKFNFDIPAAGGRAQNIKTVSNDASQANARIALHAIERLRAPAIPAAILKAEHSDKVHFEESFTIFLNPLAAPTPASKKR